MKMILAATLLGILMHAFAKECELMPPAENFDSDKYFNIPHVYVTYSKNGPQEKVCREYKTTKNSDGTTNTEVIVKTGGQQQKTVLTCTNKEKNGKPGQYSVECEVPNGNHKIQLETSVFATDNKNYALLQSCNKDGKSDYDIFVLQTNKDVVDPGVTSAFNLAKWSLKDWVSRSNVDCNNIQN
uniref:Salivary lipocalin n=1 Tax=Triatoma dimidiata TaxID=72491 RepID=D1MWE1_TRIDM|nr:hypothetical protein Td42 similar to pallidipin 2 [Triatoma dimidiata]